MNIQQALKEILLGKKIVHKDWEYSSYIEFKKDNFYNKNGQIYDTYMFLLVIINLGINDDGWSVY
jgi:hypothetical protein